MASYAFCAQLAKHPDLGRWQVTVCGGEPRVAYDRVRLSDTFTGKTPQDLELASEAWYADHHIKLRTGTPIIHIDREKQIVLTASAEEIPYDQLILATGSNPWVPPIEGVDLPGVFVYRTMEDVEAIRAKGESSQSAIVLGGGLLGLEAARALQGLGVETHVLERASRLMARQLDELAAEVLLKEIEKLGIHVHLGVSTEAIRTCDQKLQIALEGEESLLADMVVISAGVRPNDQLAKEAGLEIGPRGGIAVDDLLRTSDPRIWGLGECVWHRETLYGLVGPCYRMAEVLAANLLAMGTGTRFSEAFQGASRATTLKLMGIDVATLGIPMEVSQGGGRYVYQEPGICRTIITEHDCVVSAVGVGPWPERDRLSLAIETGQVFVPNQFQHFEQEGLLWQPGTAVPVAEWPDEATICSCVGVSLCRIREQVLNGANLEKVSQTTGAGTVCGSCRPLLAELTGEGTGGFKIPGRKTLLVVSVLSFALLIAAVVVGPWPMSQSILDHRFTFEALWRDPLLRKITGGTVVGLAVIGLALSLRKRWGWLQFGTHGFWRGVHGFFGLATLIGFYFHTGLSLGHNLTLILGVIFLALNLVGAATGAVAAMEPVSTGRAGLTLRQWRPILTWLHIGLFVPLPLLVLFHAISVFYY
ncbi:Membrane protein containing FAD-dependent pyridine nucleotide-disulfide oxidoreductase [Planctomycetales bacterium 10988]|nr:Membrane protein containing FAD-dependent pyridine nucleotide-disulfide oxidoreductase [Planctomycetales bacterium 10988]